MTPVNETPVWRLIQGAKRDKNISYRAIEAASGGRLSRTALAKYQRGEVKHLAPDTLVAISEILDIPLADLVVATLETIGLGHVLPSRSVEDSVRNDPELSELLKRKILRLIADHRAAVRAEIVHIAAEERDKPVPPTKRPE